MAHYRIMLDPIAVFCTDDPDYGTVAVGTSLSIAFDADDFDDFKAKVQTMFGTLTPNADATIGPLNFP
jgi:hypothetical protein